METQQHRVLAHLRECILRGEFGPGMRLAEIPLSERLGVSRTPVRAALIALEREGLVEPLAAGGYSVRQFSAAQIADAVRVRGQLEGMAARLVAEHGVGRALAAELHECLEIAARVLDAPALDAERYGTYIDMNRRFHDAIVRGSGNDALRRCVDLISGQPFAAAGAMLPLREPAGQGMDHLRFAHRQHVLLVQAMQAGEGTRAQALAAEHAHVALENIEAALHARQERVGVLRAAGGR